MNGLTRRLALARIGAAGCTASLRIAAHCRKGATRLEAWDDAPRELEHEAAAMHQALAAILPPSRSSGLSVETGIVEVPERRYRRAYVSAVTDLSLVACIQTNRLPLALEQSAFTLSPWQADREGAEAPGDLPVVLAPSAVLALALHLLDAYAPGRAALAACALDVEETCASPYPPRHHPWPDTPQADEQSQLLTRLDRFPAPLAGAYDPGRSNIRIAHRGARRRIPQAHILIEGLAARGAPTVGVGPWRAAWSTRAPNAALSAGAKPLFLHFSPGHVLAGASPAGASAPAYATDPFAGDMWGWAPPLVTSVSLEALR